MKSYFILVIIASFMTVIQCASLTEKKTSDKETAGSLNSIVWNIDNLRNIGGNPVTVGGEPKVIDTPKGKAVEFDGVDDALFVDVHPLEGAAEYTLEVIFCPYADGLEEQRFFHLQENGSSNRFLLETRLIGGNRWSLDTFMAAGETNQTLLDKFITHPVGRWYNVTLVFDGKEMSHYINGVRELSAQIASYVPPKKGKTSIGVRINKVYWFKGAIRKARFMRHALTPEEFLKP